MPSYWMELSPLRNMVVEILLNRREISLRADTALRELQGTYFFHRDLQKLRLD